MTILPSIDIFQKYISDSRDKAFSDINAILYNDDIDILLSSNYLNKLEEIFEDNEHLKALIVELSDHNRISVGTVDNMENEVFEKLYKDNVDLLDCLYAVTLDVTPNIEHFRYTKINKTNKNKEYILFELLKTSNLSLHYYDFTSNNEIQNFIKKIFQLPKNLSRILIYNRYSEYNHLQFLSNKSIHYFNLIPRNNPHSRRLEFIRIEADLKANLGRNLVLKSTADLTKLHERKIFFNHYILTFDQALSNILITEPNWKIDVQIDRKKCFNEWIKKNRHFANLN